MLKTKLNVLTLRKEPLPTVIFHEPEAIELCTTTPLMKTRTHTGCKVLRSINLRTRPLWRRLKEPKVINILTNMDIVVVVEPINCYCYYKISKSKSHWAFLTRNFGFRGKKGFGFCGTMQIMEDF